MPTIEELRNYLKSGQWHDFPDRPTDQNRGIPAPEFQKPPPGNADLINLTPRSDMTVGREPIIEIIDRRRSRREFAPEPLNLEELSYLLWATQGVHEVGVRTRRTVPSGGSRHPFETYLGILRVEGLENGLYRYLPIGHQIYRQYLPDDFENRLSAASSNQTFVGKSAVVFIWTAVPYRTEWRYDTLSAKLIAQDSGHLCQNLYLASESIGCGTCAIGAYDQKLMDQIVRVDGNEEFVIYVAPVGRRTGT